MPVCQAKELSFQLENGVTLFEDISFSLQSDLTGLVGSNGVGKSVLASLLIGHKQATDGHVQVTYPVAIHEQWPGKILDSDITIAEFLGVKPILDAIERIARGECSESLFNQVGNDWMVEKNVCEQMQALGLPANIHLQCKRLSGGQLARLQLSRLFCRHQGLLILDEPSNHLDGAGKQWLVNEMRRFNGPILLISHDRMMLREVDEIWELSQLGLTRFGGNYDLYHHEKRVMRESIETQVTQLRRQEKLARKSQQQQREKSDQRAAKGARIRKSGSQPNVLLDYLKNSAESAASARRKQTQAQLGSLKKTMKALKEKQEILQVATLAIPQTRGIKGQVLSASHLRLPFVNIGSIDMQLGSTEKIRIEGRNGAGKSTLLKVIAGHLQPASGAVKT